MYKKINELFGTDYKSNSDIDWVRVSFRYCLSEDFIRKYKDYLYWDYVSQYQPMSEKFMKEHKNYLSFKYISSYQILSWDFMMEFKDKLDWEKISRYQPFIDLEYSKIDKEALKDNNLCHLYQETKERGWFVGYIVPGFSKRVFKDFPYEFFSLVLAPGDYIKARIYWNDLIMKRVTSKFEPIREIKYV